MRSLVPGLLSTRSSDPMRRLVGCEIGPLLGVAGSLGLQQCVALVNPDGRKAPFGDTQRERSMGVVAAPDRQRAAGLDFFDQSFTQEFTDHIVGGAALQVGRNVNCTIVALRGGGQEYKLGVGELHRDLRSVSNGVSRRHHRSPAMARKPAGQDPGTRQYRLVEDSHTSALFAPGIQSFRAKCPKIAYGYCGLCE